MTKENFLSETEREINGSTNSLTERYSVNKCYMFITILEVLTDQTQTKIMTLKDYLAFIKINNLLNFQKSEQPIARMSRNSTRHYFNFENELNEIYFQNIRTPDSNRSSTNYFGRKSYTGHDHEKLLKVIPLIFG